MKSMMKVINNFHMSRRLLDFKILDLQRKHWINLGQCYEH